MGGMPISRLFAVRSTHSKGASCLGSRRCGDGNVFAAPAALLSGLCRTPAIPIRTHSPIALLPRAAFVCMIAAVMKRYCGGNSTPTVFARADTAPCDPGCGPVPGPGRGEAGRGRAPRAGRHHAHAGSHTDPQPAGVAAGLASHPGGVAPGRLHFPAIGGAKRERGRGGCFDARGPGQLHLRRAGGRYPLVAGAGFRPRSGGDVVYHHAHWLRRRDLDPRPDDHRARVG